jgi:RNA polymerase sigma-70 factor (ECF subfamily)
MPSAESQDVTGLLRRAAEGDRGAADELLDAVYHQLHALARSQARRISGATLQPTALVNEAWLRLARRDGVDWRDREHFLATAATAMRCALLDRARRRRAARNGDLERVPLDETLDLFESRAADVLALDEALQALAARNAQQARLVELHFFGGLTMEEAGRVLGISRATAERSWYVARAWLRDKLEG